MRGSLMVALGLSLAAAGCQRAENKPGPGREGAAAQSLVEVLRVARAGGPIKLDGELDEPAWNAVAAHTGPFLDVSGGEARPYSEARFLWDDENLYVSLYASDNDIRARVTAHDGPVWIDDAFALHLTPVGAAGASAPTYVFDISASGVTMDARRGPDGKQDASWESGIRTGVDRDGTLNDPSDEDEEWVVEAAIPLRSLGVAPAAGSRLLVDISRCDTPRNTTTRRCSAWGTAKTRRTLELAAPP